MKLGRSFVPKGRQDLAGGFSRRISSENGGSPEGTAEGMTVARRSLGSAAPDGAGPSPEPRTRNRLPSPQSPAECRLPTSSSLLSPNRHHFVTARREPLRGGMLRVPGVPGTAPVAPPPPYQPHPPPPYPPHRSEVLSSRAACWERRTGTDGSGRLVRHLPGREPYSS